MPDHYVVTRLPAVQLPLDAKLEIEQSKRSKRRKISGTHQNITYKGRADQGSNWCLAIKDKTTGQFTLVPTDVFAVECEMKDRKAAEILAIRQDGIRHSDQRTALGEVFGTRKAKAALVGRERNRVDASSLQSLESAISERILDQTSALPSNEDRLEALSESRPIPPYDLDTRIVADIYKIEGIVSSKELSQIDITPILEVNTDAERADLLPISSDFVIEHISSAIKEGINVEEKVRLLVYLSYLLTLFNKNRTSSKRQLTEILKAPSELIVDGIISRYTVGKAGQYGRSKDARFAVDPQHLDKLLCSIFVIMLHLNNFNIDIPPLVTELSLKMKHITELFHALGCKIKNLSASEAANRGLNSSKAKFYRVAQLTAPLKLPEVIKRGRAQN